ncbi:MAG: hypothetical protein OEZ65_13845 [Gemmatimonadota bacterium]|nr:hypothetical protein [Gemmatimonadota bacterium]MDH5760666.1 hypothetical protein [Gemmatimonadota bacterium]
MHRPFFVLILSAYGVFAPGRYAAQDTLPRNATPGSAAASVDTSGIDPDVVVDQQIDSALRAGLEGSFVPEGVRELPGLEVSVQGMEEPSRSGILLFAGVSAAAVLLIYGTFRRGVVQAATRSRAPAVEAVSNEVMEGPPARLSPSDLQDPPPVADDWKERLKAVSAKKTPKPAPIPLPDHVGRALERLQATRAEEGERSRPEVEDPIGPVERPSPPGHGTGLDYVIGD